MCNLGYRGNAMVYHGTEEPPAPYFRVMIQIQGAGGKGTSAVTRCYVEGEAQTNLKKKKLKTYNPMDGLKLN